jgi:EmrB/QacA subfamily drug resistance transporter
VTSSTQPRSAQAGVLFDPLLRRLGLVVVIGSLMSVLDTTIVNVAIATLARDFHTSLPTIQWVSTAYLLALATVIPLTGWAMDRFGAKAMWMFSLSSFVIGSVLAGASWSPASLIAFRVVQGIGGGMIMPIGQSMLASAAGPQRVGRMMSVMGVPALLGPILGPVLGGLLVDQASWRWIFYVNVPIGIVGLILSARLLPPDHRHGNPPLDVLGLVLLSPGLALLVYGLAEAGGSGSLTEVLLTIGLGCGFILAFVLRSLRARVPLLDVRLFKNKPFLGSALLGFGFSAALFGAMLLLPLYFQIVRGESALHAGIVLIPQGLGAGIMIAIAGRLTDSYGPRRVVIPGLVVAALGTLLLTQLHADTSSWAILVILFVRGAGFGCVMTPTLSAAYYSLRRDQVPRATTAINIIQRIGGSVGVAVLAAVLTQQISSRLGGRVGSHIIGAPLPTMLREHVAGPLAAAFDTSFWWSFGFIAAGILPALLLPRQPASAAAPPAATAAVTEASLAAALESE